eukprot:1195500-Prorocentrum_minimum.AAC.17
MELGSLLSLRMTLGELDWVFSQLLAFTWCDEFMVRNKSLSEAAVSYLSSSSRIGSAHGCNPNSPICTFRGTITGAPPDTTASGVD